MSDEEQLISGRDFMRRDTAPNEPGWVVLQADAGTTEVPEVLEQAEDAGAVGQPVTELEITPTRRGGATELAVTPHRRGTTTGGSSTLARLALSTRVGMLRGRGQLGGVVRGRGLPVILGAGLVATAMVVGALMLLGGGKPESAPTSGQTSAPSQPATTSPRPSAPAGAAPAASVDQKKPARKPRPLPMLRATVKVTGDSDRVRVSIEASARGRVRFELMNRWGRVVDTRVMRPGTLSRTQFVVKKLAKGRYTWRVTPLGGGPVRAGRVVVKTPPPPPPPPPVQVEPVTPMEPVVPAQPDPIPEPDNNSDGSDEPVPDTNSGNSGGSGQDEPSDPPVPPAPSFTPAPEPSDLPEPVES